MASGSVPAACTSPNSSGVRFWPRPGHHQRRRVAFVDGRPRKRAVGLVEQVLLLGEDREVGVLERVVVLVGERDLVGAIDRARTRHDEQLLLVRVVEAGDLAAEQFEVQLLERLVLRHQPERLVQPFAGGDVLGRVVLVEALGGLRLERLLADGLARDRGPLEAADGEDLLLDLVEDRIDRATRQRRRGRRRRRGGRGCRGVGPTRRGGRSGRGRPAGRGEEDGRREQRERPIRDVSGHARDCDTGSVRVRSGGRCRFLNRLAARP